MLVTCALTKDVQKTGKQTWKIDRAGVTVTDTTGSDGTMTLPLEINIFPDVGGSIGGTAITTGDEVTMGKWLYVQVKENPVNAFFKFVTKECYFSPSSLASMKDTFFTNYCPVGKDPNFDNFKEVSGNGYTEFEMKVSILVFFSYYFFCICFPFFRTCCS